MALLVKLSKERLKEAFQKAGLSAVAGRGQSHGFLGDVFFVHGLFLSCFVVMASPFFGVGIDLLLADKVW